MMCRRSSMEIHKEVSGSPRQRMPTIRVCVYYSDNDGQFQKNIKTAELHRTRYLSITNLISVSTIRKIYNYKEEINRAWQTLFSVRHLQLT